MLIHTLKFWSSKTIESNSFGDSFLDVVNHSENDITLIGKRNPDNTGAK